MRERERVRERERERQRVCARVCEREGVRVCVCEKERASVRERQRETGNGGLCRDAIAFCGQPKEVRLVLSGGGYSVFVTETLKSETRQRWLFLGRDYPRVGYSRMPATEASCAMLLLLYSRYRS